MSTLKVDGIRSNSASSDAITLASDGTCTANITNNLSNRNKIINGEMAVSARGTSKAYTGSTNDFLIDRFKFVNSHDGAATLTQSSTSPDGFSNSLKVDITTADTSLGSGQYSQIAQRIEAQNLQDLAFGTSSAKTIIVSFYVRSNKTGNYVLTIQQADNSYKQVSQAYTINSADTWERKTLSFAGDTSGVINNDNGSGLELYWWLLASSTYTSGSSRSAWTTYANGDAGAGQTVNLFDSTSNEWYITGVQVEVDHTGSGVATDFEHRSYAQELTLCQRYYYRWTASYDSTYAWMGMSYSTSTCFGIIKQLPVTMRATPTTSVSGTFYGFGSDGSTSGHTAFSSTANNHSTKHEIATSGWGGASGIAEGGRPVVVRVGSANDYIDASAEL
mgnify:CR=1 FL=1